MVVCCWVLGWMLSRVEQDKCCNANTFCRYKLKQKIGTVAILECSNVYVFLDYKQTFLKSLLTKQLKRIQFSIFMVRVYKKHIYRAKKKEEW